MKSKEKELAIKLRKEGKSVKYISKKLNVSKGSVSVWVRGIILTDEQKFNLSKNPGRFIGAKNRSDKARKNRLESQKEGMKIAKNKNWLHVAGCMLYWAEGAKHKNSCKLSNTDSNLLKLFIKFLLECFKVTQSNIRLHINCYTNNGVSVNEIETYWLNELSLPRSCLMKTSTDILSKYSKNKKAKNKHIYGVCSVNVYNTKIVQSIFGSIQKYGNFNNNFCLF